MKARVGVIPLIAVKRDSAGPTIILGVASGVRRDVAVVIDHVVIGQEIVAFDRPNARPAGIADAVSDEAQMVGTATKKAVPGFTTAVQMEPAEFQISRIRWKVTAVHIKHWRRVRATGPQEFYRVVTKSFVNDPGCRRAAGRRLKGGTQRVGSTQQTDDRTRPRDGCCTKKGLGGRLSESRIFIVAPW